MIHIARQLRATLGFAPMDDMERQRGQATTEYALILLVAAVIATLVIGWATIGGGSGRIGELFDSVFDSILQRAETDVE